MKKQIFVSSFMRHSATNMFRSLILLKVLPQPNWWNRDVVLNWLVGDWMDSYNGHLSDYTRAFRSAAWGSRFSTMRNGEKIR